MSAAVNDDALNDDPAEPLDQRALEWMLAYDEALAAGRETSPLADDRTPVDLRSQLEESLACVQLLRRLWPAARATGQPASATERSPAAVEDSPRSIGRFQILRELGHGGYGVVFLAHDPRLDRPVALKVPRMHALATRDMRARFQHEARAAAGLDHPNIVPLYEAGEIGAVCFIASAYCPGITLAEWLKGQAEPVDFHALRKTFITNLTRSGVAPKTAQLLARHSDINLTMNVYTMLGVQDQVTAVEALPPISTNAAAAGSTPIDEQPRPKLAS